MTTQLLEAFRLAQLPEEAQAFREEVREFLATRPGARRAAVRARTWMGFDAAFSRRLAERGWVGITLPGQYGGAGLDAFRRFVLVEEMLAAGAPVAAHWIADRQSGPLINKFGTEAQKDFYLPRICRGEAFFCIGMSEPNSGSDLASVRTRATKRRRRLAPDRPQDLDDQRAPLALHDRAGAHLGRAGRPARRPVAIHRRPLAARHRRPADRRPDRRRALLRSDLRRRLPRGRRADRRRRQRLDAGQRRTGLRAQRPGAPLFEHRAARHLDGEPAQDAASRPRTRR